MFKNYLRVALRNLWKFRVFSFINIFGLALSLSVCLLVISMFFEQKHNDSYHRFKDRIYRVITYSQRNNETATSPLPLAEALKQYQGVEKTTRIVHGFGGDAIYNQKAIPVFGYYADPDFFEIFDFELQDGNPATALQAPFSVIISEKMATKLFGNENPLGKVFSFEERGLDQYGINVGMQKGVSYGNFTITGVIKDPPYKSHIPLDIFMSYATYQSLGQQGIIKVDEGNWQNIYFNYTYVLLKNGFSEDDFKNSLNSLAHAQYAQLDEHHNKIHFGVQPLTKISPGTFINNALKLQIPLVVYYFLGILGFMIMLMAGANYTNLSIARSLERAKEVGVRKVNGASRKNLLIQFLSESVLLSLIALTLGVLFLYALKPAFNNLWVNRYLHFEFSDDIGVYVIFIAFGILVGVIAGFYPSLYISNYSPIQIFRIFKINKQSGLSIRKVLITLQFTLSLIFVISTLLFYHQVRHYLNFEYGFNQENLVYVDLQGQDYQIVAQEYSKLPDVVDISGCWFPPSSGVSIGINVKREEQDDYININTMAVTPNFIENHGINFIAGSTFGLDNPKGEVVLNQKTVSALGFQNSHQALGQTVVVRDNDKTYAATITGIVEDFHYELLMRDIYPLMLHYIPENIKYANIKIIPTDISNTLGSMKKVWNSIDPVHPYEASFLSDQLNKSMLFFQDILKIIGFMTFLSLVIASLGLLGIALIISESQIKQIAIRKILGANSWQIMIQLFKGLLTLMIIAVILAIPIAYFGNNLWLQNLANRVNFSAGIVLSGVILIFIPAMVIIVTQTIRTSFSNPVNSLRNE